MLDLDAVSRGGFVVDAVYLIEVAFGSEATGDAGWLLGSAVAAIAVTAATIIAASAVGAVGAVLNRRCGAERGGGLEVKALVEALVDGVGVVDGAGGRDTLFDRGRSCLRGFFAAGAAVAATSTASAPAAAAVGSGSAFAKLPG